MKMTMKDISHRYNINDLSLDMDANIVNINKCFSMMILLCTKQHLSKVWSSIHEKVKKHWARVEKKRCL